jgi:hypothetical protein
LAAAFVGALGIGSVKAAEYGTGPWLKGYTDILGGVIPPQPGLYVRNDAYHYQGDVSATIFDGRVQLGVEEKYLIDVLSLTYVTPLKILGGTYAVNVTPTVMQMDVNVGVGLPSLILPVGPGIPTGPISITRGDTTVAQGDTVFSPLILGWQQGNFYWNFALFGLAPTGEYSKSELANTSINHWAVMPRLAASYFNPKTGFQVSGAAIYSWNFENPATDYKTGEILNLDGSITKNFGAPRRRRRRLRHDPDHRRQRLRREAWLVRIARLWRWSHCHLHPWSRDSDRAYLDRQMVCRVRRPEHLRG